MRMALELGAAPPAQTGQAAIRTGKVLFTINDSSQCFFGFAYLYGQAS
jgi:hypothetical protein